MAQRIIAKGNMKSTLILPEQSVNIRRLACGRGMTLIEIMVCVLIVSLIGALVFPAIASARSRASLSTCTGNLRQLGVAVELYSNDWHEHYPNGRDARILIGPASLGPTVMSQLGPYVRESAIWRCPSDSGTKVDESAFGSNLDRSNLYKEFGSSYFVLTSGTYPSAVPSRWIPRPHLKALFWDGSGAWHTGAQRLRFGMIEEESAPILKTYRYNTVTFDGHVKYLSRTEWSKAWTADVQGFTFD